MSHPLYDIVATVIALILAIVFHEVAHGWAALALGDPTAREQRRLSLNPIRHVDPIGTIVLPGMLKLIGAPVFGWAKPVPVIKERLRNPRFGMMAVAAAGPLTNFVLAMLAAVALGLLLRSMTAPGAEPGQVAQFAFKHLQFFIMINVFLGMFNLLPVPPFDGSHIVEGLLPRRAAEVFEKLRPLGFPLLLILLLVIPWLFPQAGVVERLVLPPVRWAEAHYFALAEAVAGR